MSFKAVQQQISQQEGVPPQEAAAILASKTRSASPAAKKANPNLKNVKPAKKPTRVQPQWAQIGSQMLADGGSGPRTGNGSR